MVQSAKASGVLLASGLPNTNSDSMQGHPGGVSGDAMQQFTEPSQDTRSGGCGRQEASLRGTGECSPSNQEEARCPSALGQTCSITVVQQAAAIGAVDYDQEFDKVPNDPVPEFVPPKILLHGSADKCRRDVPGVRAARHWRQPQPFLYQAGTDRRGEEPVTPLQHIQLAWDNEVGRVRPAAESAAPPQPPQDILDVLDWMKTCPDYEKWLVMQIHRWHGIKQ